ncbi:MAG: hypothetical protein GX097_04195, partial [Methanomicrobiales archaeon]|nr:hypothetical protein [Methanomicrobiales archaeon]
MAMAPVSGHLTGRKSSQRYLSGKIIFFAVVSILFALTGVVSAYSGGDGSSGDPYQINNSADLIALSVDSGNWSKHFIQTDDISLSGGSPTETIGNSDDMFAGTFDGQGNIISNFTIGKSGFDYIGLFGYLGSGGKITDLTVHAGDAGVSGRDNVGILVGYNFGTITDCSAMGNATATQYYSGGLIGVNNGLITNCSASGSATAIISDAGGLVGWNNGTATITNSFATGNAKASHEHAGGLVGSNYGTITNCYATGITHANDYNAGGLVGD